MSSQKQQESRPSHSRLLSLPRELRDQIYRELLLEDLVWDEPHDRYDLQPAILRVNKQVNEEASRILYDENCWVILEMKSNVDYVDMLKRDHCRSVSSISLEKFPRRTFLKVEVKELYFIRKPTTYFMTTVEGLRGVCKNFTSALSFHPLEINLHFNISGKRRELLLDYALDAFQETRGIEHAAVFGTERVSKGNELAGFMMTRIKNLDELSVRANVYESCGNQMLEADDLRGALREYTLGHSYAQWIHHYFDRILEDEIIEFIGESSFSPLMQASDFSYAIALCLINSGRTTEAITTLEENSLYDPRQSKKHFLRGLAFIFDGTKIEAVNEFILALQWRMGVGASTSVEVDDLKAGLEGDPNPQLNIIFYYRRIHEILQHQSSIVAGQQGSAKIGGIDYLTLFVGHAWHELRETEAVSVS